MESKKMLNQIKTLLNIEVKLMDMKLENGTIVSAESFEKDNEIFIVTDDEKVAMPVGEYILEDGRLLVVEEEGMIADVREVSDEVPAKEEETTEDLEDETVETEVPEEVASEVAAIIEAVVEVIAPVIEEVKKEVEELKKKFSKFETEEETKEEEKKEELSKVKPIKHNPEAKAAQKKQVQFAKGKFNTTFDRVLNRLNK
jgi:hypothetical protein